MSPRAKTVPAPTAAPVSALAEQLLPDTTGDPLDVPLNYEIITLFSEGLYQSPHKAIEELVSNAYDAGAKTVRVLLPRDEEDQGEKRDSLFVIDDGTGMDPNGFKTLWKIAESPKAHIAKPVNGRLPIGQFGIGKLAAYVLAWRLTHVSKVDNAIYYTTMDFHRVQTHRLNNTSAPLRLRLHKISMKEAKTLLAEIRERDAKAWAALFGASATQTWTVAALSEFKGLYGKLAPGTLKWVLRTGLPITSDFKIVLDSETLTSPAESKKPIYKSKVGGSADKKADELAREFPGEFTRKPGGVVIAGIAGTITGEARLYEQPLDRGKSATQYHRNNGFFIRVRGRIINLEDELFGLEAQNHSAWSRFVLTVDADGLRDHLLSSREGVKASRAMTIFREYLHAKFNECRAVYEAESKKKLEGLDIERLLQGAPSSLIAEPFIEAVSEQLEHDSSGSYYIDVPKVEASERDAWLSDFTTRAATGPIKSFRLESRGAYDRLARLDVSSLELVINREHPFLAKIDTHAKNDTPLTMVSAVEVVTDALLREHGLLKSSELLEFFEARDRVMRIIAGATEPNAADVIRELRVANEDEVALERAVGRAFELLGMEYEAGGTNRPGDDGYLIARLGVTGAGLADFTVVYDAKTTDSTSVAAEKCDFGSLETFRKKKNATFAFFVGKGFAGQASAQSKINRKLRQHGKRPCTLLTLAALERLVRLHLNYGVPLSELRGLFTQKATTQVDRWLMKLERKLSGDRVPVRLLLEELERGKEDPHDTPSIKSARKGNSTLFKFEPGRLLAAITALEALLGPSWVEVVGEGNIILHHKPAEILAQFDRQLKLEENSRADA